MADIGKALNKWTISLIDYQANPAKTSIEKIEMLHNDFKLKEDEHKQFIDQITDEYNTKHYIPRKDNEQKAELFKMDQKDLIDRWKVSKESSVLNQLVKMKREIYEEDNIYTIYSSLKYI